MNEFEEMVELCKRDNAEKDLMYKFDLNSDSFVVDLGGYHGDWSAEIAKRYNPNIVIVEAVPDFYNGIVERFKDNTKIATLNFAVGNEVGRDVISVENDGSSLFGVSFAHVVSVSVERLSNLIPNDSVIDLLKMNIEGSEYDVFQDLFESKMINNIRNLVVQFHKITKIPSVERRNEIRAMLSQTHTCEWNYEFVFECWKMNI
jgi:FkbM family methyltransferase